MAEKKSKPEPKQSPPERKEPIRLVALSDGLFATVLTLLVLDLRMPAGLTTGSLTMADYITWLGPHLFSYVLTFLVTGTFWLAHHRDFARVDHSDRTLLGYNLVFLLFIGLFPFSTATISVGGSQAGNFPFYWAIYAANVILAGVFLSLTRMYAASHGLVREAASSIERRHVDLRQLAMPAVFLLSIIVEFLFPRHSVGPFVLLLIPVVAWGVDRYYARLEPERIPPRPTWREILWRAGSILPWVVILGLAVWAMVR